LAFVGEPICRRGGPNCRNARDVHNPRLPSGGFQEDPRSFDVYGSKPGAVTILVGDNSGQVEDETAAASGPAHRYAIEDVPPHDRCAEAMQVVGLPPWSHEYTDRFSSRQEQ
jgi:hypothetical protein